MLKRVVKFIAFLAITAIVVIPVAALLVDDETMTEMLQDIPGGTGQTDAIIMHKRLLASTIINYVDDTLFSLELIILETTDNVHSSLKLTFLELFRTFLPDGTQKKVVIYLPTRTMTKTPSRLGNVLTQPAPKQLNPKPELASLPATTTDTITKPAATKKRLPAKRLQSNLKSKKAADVPTLKNTKKTLKKNVRIASARKDHERGLKFYKSKNFKKASQWFRQAAKKGYAGAQYNLGVMSYLGQGVPQNYTQAASWFEKAGNQDHASAQYNLGYIYYEGKGVEKDNLQAYMWIDRSANLGDKKAIRARDTMQIILPKEIFN